MMNIEFCKYLISINSELIEKTAISNCHCIGLNSFIINEKPKIRLFIAEQNCELYGKFDLLNPIIPIHPHKYDDIFTQLEGTMIHHLYELGDELEFNKYKYLRISDKSSKLELIGKEKLIYLGGMTNMTELKAKELHTASLVGFDNRCSWMITETFENKLFEQIAYHQNLITRKELYVPILNGNEYLKTYFGL